MQVNPKQKKKIIDMAMNGSGTRNTGRVLKLIKEYHVSNGQLDRLRKNADVSIFILNRLCEIVDCNLEDIAEYKKS